MAKPIANTPATPLTFEQRLKVVQAEVRARVSTYPKNQHSGIRARLWVNWLKRHVLEVQS